MPSYHKIKFTSASASKIFRATQRLTTFISSSPSAQIRDAGLVELPPVPNALLLESGDTLLLETGDRILLEQ